MEFRRSTILLFWYRNSSVQSTLNNIEKKYQIKLSFPALLWIIKVLFYKSHFFLWLKVIKNNTDNFIIASKEEDTIKSISNGKKSFRFLQNTFMSLKQKLEWRWILRKYIFHICFCRTSGYTEKTHYFFKGN